MKKKIIAATMAAAMCVSLAACGGSTGILPPPLKAPLPPLPKALHPLLQTLLPPAMKKLTCAWHGGVLRTAMTATIKAIELYESLHPNVKIEYEYYSFDDYFTKLKTLVASDQVWDIFQRAQLPHVHGQDLSAG